MLNPNYKKYAKRIEKLISEAERLLTKETDTNMDVGEYFLDETEPYAWKVKVENILKIVFTENSPQMKNYSQILKSRHITFPSTVRAIKGVLVGALEDLNEGFLEGQEFIVASELFDDVLQKAEYLNKKKYKDSAAVLCRVVLESALKKIAASEDIACSQKASKINNELKTKDIFNKPRWRQNQTWLDIGNSAAHGDFSDYSEIDVKQMIKGIEQFLASEFKA